MNGNLSVWERGPGAQGWGPSASGGGAHSWWLHHTQTNTHTHPRPSWYTHAHTRHRRLSHTRTARRRLLFHITWFHIYLFFPPKISNNSSECQSTRSCCCGVHLRALKHTTDWALQTTEHYAVQCSVLQTNNNYYKLSHAMRGKS